ncbi:RDD family protein [Streptomyces antibioticus]|uniref:RDD family protein n=1 Tax=Streptomyces antibioticus TaxID=1890 RepID=UPI0033C970EA
MSAPTPAPGDDRPREGFYPDPSIPGYVRYWNGSAWVPGTSRPAPSVGEPLTPPAASVEETGPHFFDEDPSPAQQNDGRSEPASAWGADRARQSGFGGDQDRRVSWGADPRLVTAEPAEPAAEPPGTGGPSSSPAPAPAKPGFGAGKAAADRASAAQAGGAEGFPPAAGQSTALSGSPAGTPAVPAQSSGPAPMSQGLGGGQSSWAQQVHRLAGGDEPVAPWKPPVDDIFQAAARRQAAARPASLGKRLGARLVDTLVLAAVTGAAAVPLGVKALDHVNDKIDAAELSGRTVTVWLLDGTTSVYLAIVVGVLLVFGILYEALPTARWGRTLGKKLFGLDVRDIEAHEPPGFGAALRRWLVYILPALLGIGLLGVLWCLFDKPWRQCWHDKAAHTFVAG